MEGLKKALTLFLNCLKRRYGSSDVHSCRNRSECDCGGSSSLPTKED